MEGDYFFLPVRDTFQKSLDTDIFPNIMSNLSKNFVDSMHVRFMEYTFLWNQISDFGVRNDDFSSKMLKDRFIQRLHNNVKFNR